MLWKSSSQNKVFKIVWGEFLEKRELIHEKYCAWDHLRGTCAPSPPTPTTPAQIKGTNRHQISGLQLSLGNHCTLAAHTPTKYCRDIFHLHHLSLTTPKIVNLVKRSSLAYFGTLGRWDVEFKIMWEEPLDVRNPHKILCLKLFEGNSLLHLPKLGD